MTLILLYVNHRLLQSKKEGIAEDQAAHCEHGKEQDRVEVLGMADVIIPEEKWQKIQELSERIKHREWEQEEDTKNLNNLLHALHGEGVRGREYTENGKPAIFQNGEWVYR